MYVSFILLEAWHGFSDRRLEDTSLVFMEDTLVSISFCLILVGICVGKCIGPV